MSSKQVVSITNPYPSNRNSIGNVVNKMQIEENSDIYKLFE